MRKFLSRYIRNDDGSNALEYGLIVGLISVAIVAGATTAGIQLGLLFTTVATDITAAVALV
jgi:pilus assembly protein Flp/PilA